MAKRLTEAEKADILRLGRAGMSVNQIVPRVGRSGTTVAKVLDEAGVDRRSPNGGLR